MSPHGFSSIVAKIRHFNSAAMIFYPDHIFLRSTNQVCEICQPLFDNTPINYFKYDKTYSDGSSFALDTNNKFIPYLIEHQIALPLETLRNFARFSLLTNLNFRSNQQTLQPDRIALLLQNQFAIDHILLLTNKTPDYVELFAFGTAKSTALMTEFYLNNITLLEDFTVYFKETATKLIAEANQPTNRFSFSHSAEELYSYFQKNTSTHWRNKKIIIHTKESQYDLTALESACLKSIAQGYTAKEIALQLHLSPRTIESYTEQLKSKLNCTKKSQLGEFYRKYCQNKFFTMPHDR